MVKHEEVLHFRGKGQLVVSPEGIQLRNKSGSTLRHELPWNLLRELKNDLSSSGTFRANFGGADGELPLTVKVLDGDATALSVHLDSLPHATAVRCGHCAGPVIEKTCLDCGKNFRDENRKTGLLLLCIGILGTFIFAPLASKAIFAGSGAGGVLFTLAAGSSLATAMYGVYQISTGAR